jgi:hypothetical protein
MHGQAGGVRKGETGFLQRAIPASICQFFPRKCNGNTLSWRGYFRITIGLPRAGTGGALVPVVLYGAGTNSERPAGADWGLNLIRPKSSGRLRSTNLPAPFRTDHAERNSQAAERRTRRPALRLPISSSATSVARTRGSAAGGGWLAALPANKAFSRLRPGAPSARPLLLPKTCHKMNVIILHS